MASLSSAQNIWHENLKAQWTWHRPWLVCGCFILLGVSSPARMKLHKSFSRLRTALTIQTFYSKHITARGRFAGFVERSTQAKAHVDAGMGLYDEARHERHRFLYLGTTRLFALCRSSQFCNGPWAIRRRGYSRSAMQLIWRGACSTYRRWLMHFGLCAKPRLFAVMLRR